MKNLSKKHLKQIYRRSRIAPLTKFFRAAPNNRADYNKMMAWRWSMCTNVHYMVPGEKIKRRKKYALQHESLAKSVYSIGEGIAGLEVAILNATDTIINFTSNLRGAFEKK